MQPESLYSRTGCRNTQLEPSFTGDDMHYYQFNIGDYQSHTSHLTELEDIAYRRMLDWLYLHEKPLPLEIEQIARLIRMRTHSESIANVLQEFFARNQSGFYHKRVVKDLKTFKEKSAKAKASAKARWSSDSKGLDDDANGMRTHSEGNANHKPRTNNHKPITKGTEKPKRFIPPTLEEIASLCREKNYSVNPNVFLNHYESNGWMVGKNKMKSWPAALANWQSKQIQDNGQQTRPKKMFPGLDQ